MNEDLVRNDYYDLTFYHGGCMDGLACAWVYNYSVPTAPLGLPLYHGDRQKKFIEQQIKGVQALKYKMKDKKVGPLRILFMDICPEKEFLLSLHREGHDILVIDHHIHNEWIIDTEIPHLFDNEKLIPLEFRRSGCGQTWAYFQSDPLQDNMPILIKHIQERDIWRFGIENSAEVNAYLRALNPNTVSDLDRYVRSYHSLAWVTSGRAIMIDHDAKVNKAVSRKVAITIDGKQGLITGSSVLCSEIGHAIAKDNPNYFGATYFIRTDGMVGLEFRSVGDLDVSKVAKSLGGAGHKNASGAVIPLGKFRKMMGWP